MPQLGYTKSRKGCKRCKQRRVKCDEQIPCSSCLRRNEECSLLDVPSRDSSEPAVDSAIPLSSEDWMLDLELMCHYTTFLHHLGAREKVVHLWRTYILQQALRHPFLMHGLLALAALHLAYLRPDSSFKYLQLCDKHQAVALQKFRSILSSPVDPELAGALFALAATISVSSMARSCASTETTTMDMDAVAELFVLTKGVKDMIQLSYQHIQQSPMAEMLKTRACPKGAELHLPPGVSARFEAIRHMLLTSGLDQDAREHCRSALADLEDIYDNIAYFSPTTIIETGDVSQWEVRVPMGYVRLIQARSPPALIILAYYAAAITAIRTAWYAQNWAEKALRGISDALDHSMQQWISWPMQQMQDRMSELGVHSLDEESRSSDIPMGF